MELGILSLEIELIGKVGGTGYPIVKIQLIVKIVQGRD